MTSDERTAWLANLKVGDEVIVSRGYSYRNYERTLVKRSTPKQIIVGNEKFWRESGQLVGGGGCYVIVELEPLTDEIQESLERSLFKSRFDNPSRLANRLPISTVRKLLAVLAEAEQEGKGEG